MAEKFNVIYVALSNREKHVEDDINNTLLDIYKNHSVNSLNVGSFNSILSSFTDNNKIPIWYLENTEESPTFQWPDYLEEDEELTRLLPVFVKCVRGSLDAKITSENINKCIESTMKSFFTKDEEDPEDEGQYTIELYNIIKVSDLYILVFVNDSSTTDIPKSQIITVPSNVKEASEYMTKLANEPYDDLSENPLFQSFNLRLDDNNVLTIGISW
jgi:hypothetical protein